MAIDIAPEPLVQRESDAKVAPPEVVVGIVGRAGAGKTQLAAEMVAKLSADFGSYSIVSFNEAIRKRAKREARVGRSTRRIMAQVGAEWATGDPEGMVRDVLKTRAFPSSLVVVDGVHHVDVLRMLRLAVSPATIAIIHLKAPQDAVLKVATMEDQSLRPEEVLKDSTEHDVDRELLATANLVLDGSAPIKENAEVAAAFIKRMQTEKLETPDYVGGLDADQRERVVVAVEEDFRWLLPSEVADAVGVSHEEAQSMVKAHRLLAVNVNGAMLCPGFVLTGSELNSAVSQAAFRLHGVLSDWELALWCMSGNGYLDGFRPIDPEVSQEDLDNAIEEELDY